MKKFILFLIAVLFLFPVVSWGQLITSDNFNYADNALLTDNGWIAHSGGGTQAIDVGASNGLTYTGYSGLTGTTGAVVGNAARLDNNGEDDSKTFTAVTSGTIYFSFLVNVTTGTAGYFAHLGGSSTLFAARIYVKPSTTSGKINFGISNTSTASYATTPTDFDPGTTYLIIVRYDVSTTGAASLWVKSSGVPSTEIDAGTPEHTTTGTGQSSIDRFCLRQYIASQNITVDGLRVGLTWNDAPLPVELTSFTSNVNGNKVELNWKTATEVNNYGFSIERSAVSGQPNADSWTKIGFVEGNGNSNSPKSYSFMDEPTGGKEFNYRLKQIDFDGAYEYSEIITAALENVSAFVLEQNFPNPFNPTTKISYTIPQRVNVKLKIYDMIAQQVAELVNTSQEAGHYQVTFDGSDLPSGVYFYKLEAGKFVEVKKFMLIK